MASAQKRAIRVAAMVIALCAVTVSTVGAQETPLDNAQNVPERPKILPNRRFEEDWSVLADPRIAREPLDGLKYIPFSLNHPTTYLSLGLDLRERVEVDHEGNTASLTAAEILVVAPYNMQVRCLREALPEGVEVGTVDKFQGREAAVVFFSMASSSGEDVPRGLEFLFNQNRFNVAVSRAKCLSVVVCSPRLLDGSCRTVAHMRLVNALCRFSESAVHCESSG